MKLLLRALCTLLLLGPAAEAQLLIYRGLQKVTAFPPQSFTKAGDVLIIDVAASRLVFLDYFVQDGQKSQNPNPAVGFVKSTAPLRKGKTGTFIVTQDSTVSFQNSSDFVGFLVDLVGVNSTIKYVDTPNAPTLRAPRSYTIRTRAVFPQRTFSAKGGLVFDPTLTRRENNAGHSLEETARILSAELEAQGYAVPAPSR